MDGKLRVFVWTINNVEKFQLEMTSKEWEFLKGFANMDRDGFGMETYIINNQRLQYIEGSYGAK